MPLKPQIKPKLKGVRIGSSFSLKEKKIIKTGNPKTPVSAKIAKRRKPKNTWRKAT